MKKEFIVERQGRSFVLYAGLLDLAHQHGLKSIHTQLIQVPSQANNNVAIATATVVLERDGTERIFTGIGDAAPNNVAPAMQSCLMRMSETRAKARALRDAVNIGVAAFEELGEEDATDGAPERGYAMGRGGRQERAVAASRLGGNSRPQTGSRKDLTRTEPLNTSDPVNAREVRDTNSRDAGTRDNNGLLTEDQRNAVNNLCRRRGLEADVVASEKFGVTGLSALTQTQAGELIRGLSSQSAQSNGRSTAVPA